MTVNARAGRPRAPLARSIGAKAAALLATAAVATGLLPVLDPAPAAAAAPGFTDSVMISGLDQPTALEFAADGRVFVAEKSGLVKVFSNSSDTTADIFVDLRTKVHNFWDRGLLGLALAPNFPADPYVYVAYTHDAVIGGTAPRWGSAGATSDGCPDPPGATGNGCVVSARVSRFLANGNVASGAEQVLVEGWCSQFPSHTIGDLKFGTDGALYVSGGDGASFNYVDYGQTGNNVCNDQPAGNLTLPTSHGGALRSQKVITDGVPVSLNGSVLRIDPATGAGLASNPYAGSADANARRIIASGMRNPFRFDVRPGSSELYIGDVGWNVWEEIDVVADTGDNVAENFGWPCYEGNGTQGGYAALNATLCQNLYSSGAARSPFYSYSHGSSVVSGDGCRTSNGASISGIAFNDSANNYPARFDGALFFTDLQYRCIWVMLAGADGKPDPTKVEHFINAQDAAYLTTDRDGDLWYAEIGRGELHRITYGTPTPTECPAGQYVAEYFNNLTMAGAPALSRCETVIDNDWGMAAPVAGVNADNFSVRWTTTRTLAAGTYQFTATADDGIRVFVDDVSLIDQWRDQSATTFTASRALTAGPHTIRVEYYDSGYNAVAKVGYTVTGATNAPPVPVIASPTATTTWKVGDSISFSGSATDPEDGAVPASRLTWRVAMLHCPDLCHEHLIETFTGVTSGSIAAPDHDYPSKIQIQLTATDSQGVTNTATRALDPQTATLRFVSSPSGLSITHNSVAGVAPFDRTVILGSVNSISAATPQTSGATTYAFSSWSDGGAASHNVTAAAGITTYTATFTPQTGPVTCAAGQFLAEYFNNMTLTGTPVLSRCEATINNDWGEGSPGPGVNVNGFSVRWSGSPVFAAGSHTFTTTADDGVRVFVDGVSLIDQWRDQGPTTFTGTRSLTAGAHAVRMEFYENGGGAVARLSWVNTSGPTGPVTCTATQFLAEYFNNITLTGTPVLSRCESVINNDWGSGSPGPGVNVDNFSVRWTASPTFAAGSHLFSTTADDGVRVFVDGVSLIDQWRAQSPTTFTATRALTAGTHAVRMEYYEAGGGAVARLSWTNTGVPANQPPTASITAPTAATPWAAGSTITFAGSATDPENGALAPAALSWQASLLDCSTTCQETPIGTFDGVAGGSFVVPAHTGPKSLQVELTATDAGGLTNTATVLIAPAAVPGTCVAGQFLAEYFNNMTLTGTPVLSRCEATINNDWGTGSPGPGVNVNGFSVRWTGSPVFTAGSHTFTTTADDGVRVFVDGVSLIDQWRDQGSTTFTGTRSLTAGAHVVRMEFYENGGGAVARLSWVNTSGPTGPVTCAATQFLAEYFNNITLTGTPVLSRCESAINNDWGSASPGPGVNVDNFSVRWTASPTFTAGAHTFTTTADDGVRVFVDGTSLINQWRDQGPTTYSATRTLTAGTHTVRMEYYERTYGAVARLSWT